MLYPRIIPCLLIHQGGLVKTIQFNQPKYVGDPLNAVRIFNEKEVDELIVVDIDATDLGREPNYTMIANLASECRMPLCYGGGVKTPEQVERLISLGVEKVAISSAAIANPELITKSAQRVGNQSIVVVLDVKKTSLVNKHYEVFTHNGKKPTGLCPAKFAYQSQLLGAGEVLLNSIDQDGTLKGYDIALIDKVREAIHIPMTVLGGAGSYADIKTVIQRYGVIGAAAGSLFVFKGKHRAVLIQYPNRSEKDDILSTLS
ncbi:AglZ/HisF2 family acetamidino modification protein [Cylindrospermopsis raciborskii]|uniref:AglZ/HisF2 family acetamidino modification protein n=1 Tax=Cylindrospermopsis raciborskii TaxID=77022 RepID=UPI0022CCEB70|nr:AglZ/HisF2 family acetamidino modification protein [Cylindrospermopsis raciborskii]MCZ2207578.1 AglZ/HisF2 family acetamidino modification protein [Cylindrospermopsis raciborskii PAMP2011]